MQGLILAAGRGSRLGDYRAATPKCLLEVGRQPLIEHQLRTLSEAGVGPIAMVLGYCADEIREVVGIGAEYIISQRWQSTNSLYSFSLARDWVKGPVLVLNSDILFHPEILNRLLAQGGDAIAYDSSSGDGREHMGVEVVDGLLRDMAKDLPEERTTGENVGILCFSAATTAALFERAEALLADGGEMKWLGSAVREIARERPIKAVDVAGLPWAEIDFPHDLDRARKEVWPAIQADRRVHRRHRRLIVSLVIMLLLVTAATLATILLARPAETAAVWSPMEMTGAPTTTIHSGKRTQRWSLLQGEGSRVTVEVTGPDEIRIDSRLLLPQGAEGDDEYPYVVDIWLDDERVLYESALTARSNSWKHGSMLVCKRAEFVLAVPEGDHRIQVQFASPIERSACLVRLLQPDSPTEGE